MKMIIIGMLILTLVFSCSINAEQKLSIDLIKGEINGKSIVNCNFDEIVRLLGKPDSYAYYDNPSYMELFYTKLGLTLDVGRPGPRNRLNIYLDKHDSNLEPFSGDISFGITGKNKIEDLPDLFNGYTLTCISKGDNLDYYSIDLKTHKLDIYCNSQTHNLSCLILLCR